MLPKPSGSWTFLLSGSYVTRLALPTVSDPLGRKTDGCQGWGLRATLAYLSGFCFLPTHGVDWERPMSATEANFRQVLPTPVLIVLAV